MSEHDQWWLSRLCATLDTPGGHVLVMLLIIWTSAAFIALGITQGSELMLLAAGVLFRSMLGQNGNSKS